MECKFCNEKEKSKLMKRSRVVYGAVETIDICLNCLWIKLHDDEDGEQLLSKKEYTERGIFK